ncbi:hypothetical protein [Microbacterium sp. P05]|uniref:hypothetical protein n=1 Tax=Microbacterium sp. P05 TaxID=3366948 RepID=UPI003745CA60
MEPLFDFLRQFWWLAFPLFGGLAAVGGAWEKAARDRHERRLEVLRAKSELKAAQARELAPTSPPAPIEDEDFSPLSRLMASHDDVTARWLEYELDVGKTIDFPAMSDGRQPLTAAFLRAKKVADRLRPPSATTKLSPEQLREYRDAVTDFEVAFDVAERDARRLKDSAFTDPERKRLDTAKQLLTTAVDTAATPAERQLAYRRVRDELNGLISLSDGAIDVLEKQVALQLPRGRDAASP